MNLVETPAAHQQGLSDGPQNCGSQNDNTVFIFHFICHFYDASCVSFSLHKRTFKMVG